VFTILVIIFESPEGLSVVLLKSNKDRLIVNRSLEDF
jgi:hypothetical protein